MLGKPREMIVRGLPTFILVFGYNAWGEQVVSQDAISDHT